MEGYGLKIEIMEVANLLEKTLEKNKILTESLQNIEVQVKNCGIKTCDMSNPLHECIYHINHFTKESLKQTSNH